MKQRLRKLLDRVRRRHAIRWPWRMSNPADRVAFLLTRTGWTVHRDVALRMRNLSVRMLDTG